MNTTLEFDWLDDETCQIWVNKELVYTMGHGPHGWDGMLGIYEAFQATALHLRWTIKVFGEPGI